MSFRHGACVLDSPMDKPQIFEMMPKLENIEPFREAAMQWLFFGQTEQVITMPSQVATSSLQVGNWLHLWKRQPHPSIR